MNPRCGNCGYNLTGAPGNRCPECGKLFIEAGVVVRREPRRSPWRLLFLILAFAALIAIAFFTLHAARAAQARAALEAARARAAAAFLQQRLATPSNPPSPTSLPTTQTSGTTPDAADRP